jgi:alkylhydroperoxidase family enzyme
MSASELPPEVAGPLGELRAAVGSVPPAPAELEPFLARVRERAYTLTDADVEALQAAGFGDDEIFEQTVAAAVGEGFRRLDAALSVLG